ncbi:MAG TPA: epoxyqueuosine reductase, partial [Firmicutes bacterium]|nr:epoxyqueuosine reductase [Bacillota bacterium]
DFQHIPKAISLGIHHPLNHEKMQLYSPFYYSIDRRLLKMQKMLVSWLRFAGWRALAIPPDSNRYDNSYISRLYPLFPHKTAATCAGLGWVGKSGLLVSDSYGPYVNWASVLTDAPLEICKKPIIHSYCGNCRRCVDVCPAGAIKDIHWIRGNNYQSMIDIERCTARLEMNIKKTGNPSCGLCILACPQGIFLAQKK